MNSLPNTAPGQMKMFADTIDAFDAEIKELNKRKSDLFKDAKAAGADLKALKKAIRDRHRPHEEVVEAVVLHATYYSWISGKQMGPPKAGTTVAPPPPKAELPPPEPEAFPPEPTVDLSPEDASIAGYEAGREGKSEDENPCESADSREAWAEAHGRGMDEVAAEVAAPLDVDDDLPGSL